MNQIVAAPGGTSISKPKADPVNPSSSTLKATVTGEFRLPQRRKTTFAGFGLASEAGKGRYMGDAIMDKDSFVKQLKD